MVTRSSGRCGFCLPASSRRPAASLSRPGGPFRLVPLVVLCGAAALAACAADRPIAAGQTVGSEAPAVSTDGGNSSDAASSGTVPPADDAATTTPVGSSTEPPPLPTADPSMSLTTIGTAASSSSTAAPSTTEPVDQPSTSAEPDEQPAGGSAEDGDGTPSIVDAERPTLEVIGAGAAEDGRIPAGQNYAPFATFADVTLVHPSIRVERIGFHESNHDGARQLEPTTDAIDPIVLASRQRGTGSRTAADIVVEPGTEIRSPVTGTVLRSGGYVLYCDHQDHFVVIEPDSHPGWEVKVLHVNGVLVAAGDRVAAGVSIIAPEATILPFDSQVDQHTAIPAWPHVHIELVDPSIPDRPSPGGGC